jgi:TctA family transporter
MPFVLGQPVVKFINPLIATGVKDLKPVIQFFQNAFSGTGGKVLKTSIQVGVASTAIGLGLSGLGTGASSGINQVTNSAPDLTTGKGISSFLVLGIIALVIILVVLKK